MLANSVVHVAVPVTDLDRAQRLYGETLGLLEASMGDPAEGFGLPGGQTMLHLYESPPPSAATGATR